jgi:hypothetical protein
MRSILSSIRFTLAITLLLATMAMHARGQQPAAQNIPVLTNSATPGTLEAESGAQLLSLVNLNGQPVKVDEPSKSQLNAMQESKDAMKDQVPTCNGQRNDLSGSDLADAAASVCKRVSNEYAQANAEEEVMKALILGCWWDSQASTHSRNCQGLAGELVSHGNTEAASVILSQASGCDTRTHGDPVNQCFGFVEGNPQMLQLFTGDQLMSMAQNAYSREQDLSAAQYLQSVGVAADVAAAQQNNLQTYSDSAAAQQQVAAQNAAAEAASQAKMNSPSALVTALQSLPGAGPDSIQQTVDQQQAAILAAGNANAAAAQVQRQANALAAQQAAAQQAAIQAQQNANQPAPYSAPTTSAGNSTGASAPTLAPITQACISEFWDPNSYNWLSFQNNCGQPINLTWIARNPTDPVGAASADIAASQATNTGWSQTEVTQKQDFALFICPSGSYAADSTTRLVIRSPTSTYVCLKR